MTYELSGAYNCTLDNKGRFRMPSELMKQLGEKAGRKFVINRALDECLTLYPLDVWEAEKVKVRANVDAFNPAHRRFERIYIQAAEEVELDGQDRFLVQKRFVDFAKLDKELVLATNYDRIELWDKAVYDGMMNINADDLSSLAFAVMGTKS
jgi:MraZ protein